MCALHVPGRETHTGRIHGTPKQCQHAALRCLRRRPPAPCVPQQQHGLHCRQHVFASAAGPAVVTPPAPLTAPQQGGSLTTLHPASQASHSGYLQASPVHSVAYYQYGNPHGPAAVFLHGGPGAACWPNHSRFFDLSLWRVILLDQRGCGNSLPRGCLVDNTTEALVGDLEQLRTHLQLDEWLVCGGSWGSTLALAYASTHPSRVTGLVLRGVCLMRDKEVDWMFGGGAGMLRPAAWSRFLSHLPPEDRHQPLIGYYKLLLSPEPAVQAAAASSWMAWESAVSTTTSHTQPTLQLWSGGLQPEWQLTPHPQPQRGAAARTPPIPLPTPPPSAALLHGGAPGQVESSSPTVQGVQGAAAGGVKRGTRSRETTALLKHGRQYMGCPDMPHSAVQALLVCHYCVNHAFELQRNPLLSPARLQALRTIPCIAVQGQADMVCPPGTAWELHEAWPEMELRLVPEAGHSMYDPRITHELVEAVQAFEQVAAAAHMPPN